MKNKLIIASALIWMSMSAYSYLSYDPTAWSLCISGAQDMNGNPVADNYYCVAESGVIYNGEGVTMFSCEYDHEGPFGSPVLSRCSGDLLIPMPLVY
ncbi:hypothetical protein [Roseivirga sp.]|uniref:hypothetical protein n=1 Tax=Roseivirga sp. TaxID=1964215 RepID=UPI003B8DC43B